MPAQAATAAATTGLAYSTERRLEQLCDGSYLSLVQTAVNTLSLVQITSPSGTPAFTTLAQTFSVTSGTNTTGDLFILNNGTTTSDVWVVWSDNSSHSGLFVAHGTYTASGASWSWDNTSTSIALGSFTFGFMLPSIVWTGSNLIVATRANSTNYGIAITYTTTKNGATGWAALATLDGGNLTSHCYPLLRHDAVNGCTLCIYTLAGDTVHARVVADATTPSVANWSASVALSSTTGVGAANLSAVLDTANSRLHVVYGNSSASTNPQYNSATYTTTSISAGTSFSVDSGAGTFTAPVIGLDNATPPNAYVFWATGAVGSASDIEYAKIASPYSSAGAATNLTGASANDNAYPHVPVQSAVSGYIPLVYAHAVSPWAVEYDNSIALSVTVTGSATFAAAHSAYAAQGAITGIGAANVNLQTAFAAFGVQVITGAATFAAGKGAFVASPFTPGTGIGDLAVSTKSQTWSGGPTGSPGTETDVTYTDTTGGGWSVGLIPTYGGMPIASWYEVDASAAGANQTSLTTSTADGAIHWLEQNGSGAFAGSEDKPFTLTELAPTGTAFRRYYQCSFGPDANGFNWVGYACIYPGDPGVIAYRFDCINPGASAITLAGSDGLELALIGGLEQSDTTWNATNGGYGTLAGGNTAPWPTASATGNPVTANPDYVYIAPAAGSGVKVGRVTTLQKQVSTLTPAWATPQIAALVNTNRLKLKLFGTVSTFPASTTSTAYLLWAFRRNLTAADAFAISADYINPGTPSVSVGAFSSFSYDEAAFVVAASTDNRVTATLDMTPAHVTVRYKPRYKITGWTGGTPLLSWGGANLTAGVDYRHVEDTTNHVLYVQIYADVVASGATLGQRNNAALAISPDVLTGSATFAAGHGGYVAAGAVTVTGHATFAAGHAAYAASGVQVVTGHAVTFAAGHIAITATGHQTFTGGTATFAAGHTAFAASSSGQIVTGHAVTFAAGHGAYSVAGVQVVTGHAVTFAAGHAAYSATPGVQSATGRATFAAGHAGFVATGHEVLSGAASPWAAGHAGFAASGFVQGSGAATLAAGHIGFSVRGIEIVSKAATLTAGHSGFRAGPGVESYSGRAAVAAGHAAFAAHGYAVVTSGATLTLHSAFSVSDTPAAAPSGVSVAVASGPSGVSVTER